jgi:hypothetical protein
MSRAVLDRGTKEAEGARVTIAGLDRVALFALAAGAALIVATHAWGRWLQARGHRMAVNAPPLTGNVDPRVSWWSVPALAVGAGIVGGADRAARSLHWRQLLWLSFGAALAWSISLALWDGVAGLVEAPAAPVDYLAALPQIDDVGMFLRTLVDAPRTFPTHVQAHPPGSVLFLVGMRSLGVATPRWVAAIEHVVAASSVPAVMITARALAGERLARATAPFLVGTPIVLAWSSGDAVFLGVGAWAVTWSVLAFVGDGRRADGLALASGIAWAVGIFLSYGLVLLAFVPLAVAVERRAVRAVVLVALPVVVAILGAAMMGFWWLDGLNATREAYSMSIARVRPYHYFLVANLAAAAIALGPAVWAGLARYRDRRLAVVAASALLAIVIADLSGLSKAEVERIWLPFLPWLTLVGVSALTGLGVGGRRGWLATQVAWTVVVQWAVLAPW